MNTKVMGSKQAWAKAPLFRPPRLFFGAWQQTGKHFQYL